MKRTAVLKKLKAEAKRRGIEFSVRQGSRHSIVTVGSTSRTLGRHGEVPDGTAKAFFDQYAEELGKGWWR
jgi:hypothetical protein